jgi:N-acetylneuraminic acid mutarotase
MPSARRSLSTCALDGKIYAFGGYVPGATGHPGVATLEVYDPATDIWKRKPDMPTERFGLRTSVVGGKIYVIGGMEKWVGSASGTLWEYDP